MTLVFFLIVQQVVYEAQELLKLEVIMDFYPLVSKNLKARPLMKHKRHCFSRVKVFKYGLAGLINLLGTRFSSTEFFAQIVGKKLEVIMDFYPLVSKNLKARPLMKHKRHCFSRVKVFKYGWLD